MTLPSHHIGVYRRLAGERVIPPSKQHFGIVERCWAQSHHQIALHEPFPLFTNYITAA
jgi:hypothetical protein